MDVSIILVSYNTKDLTRDCLNSIYEKTKDVKFEVFVVDNNSHDGSPEMIEKEFPQVRLIKNPDNKGFGAANNIAIKESNAKYVFLLNTDTLLLDNAVKTFFDFMENPENQNVGTCGGHIYYPDMSVGDMGGHLPSPFLPFIWLFKLHKIFPKTYQKFFSLNIASDETKQSPYSIDYVIGADMFIRKSVLDKISIFDEDFFMFYEETDLCKRMKDNGYKCYIIPDAKIIHKVSASTNNEKRIKMVKESECLYFKKHYGLLLYILLKIYAKYRYKI